MKPTNIVYAEDSYGEPTMTFDWKGERITLYSWQKPQFLEQGAIFLGYEWRELVPPVNYSNPAWGWDTPALVEGLAYDGDLVAAFNAFAALVNDGTISQHYGRVKGTP